MALFCLMFRFYLRSDAQRSEEHKLRKEKELEKEIAASEREDDGGFSMQVKIILFLTLVETGKYLFLAPRRLRWLGEKAIITPHPLDLLSTASLPPENPIPWSSGTRIFTSNPRKLMWSQEFYSLLYLHFSTRSIGAII